MLDIYALVSDLYNHNCHGLYVYKLVSCNGMTIWKLKCSIHNFTDTRLEKYNIKCDIKFQDTLNLSDRIPILKNYVKNGTPAFFVADKIGKFTPDVYEFFEEDLELKVHGIDTRRKFWRSIHDFKNDKLYQNSRLGQTV